MKEAAKGEDFLGKTFRVEFDRPLGSSHPNYGWKYPFNYGFVPGHFAGDGEEIDAYYLSSDKPLKEIEGVCVGYVHRLDDNEDKLILTDGERYSVEELEEKLSFQEKWYKHKIILEDEQ